MKAQQQLCCRCRAHAMTHATLLLPPHTHCLQHATVDAQTMHACNNTMQCYSGSTSAASSMLTGLVHLQPRAYSVGLAVCNAPSKPFPPSSGSMPIRLLRLPMNPCKAHTVPPGAFLPRPDG